MNKNISFCIKYISERSKNFLHVRIFISGHYFILRKKNCIFLLDYLTCYKRKILFVIARDDFTRFIVTSKFISI